MIRINLLPYREMRRKADIRRQIVILVSSALIFFLIIGSIQLYMSISIRNLEGEVKSAGEKLRVLVELTGDIDKFKKDKEIMERKVEIIENLEKNRKDPVRILDELSIRIPARQIWLTSIEKNGTYLKLEGVAVNNPAIALFMKTLEASSYIESVDLVSSRKTTFAETKLMSFTLSCILGKG
jgi:type IV pilus assembly protein PilN